MAELGQTDDPRQLVPGNAAAIGATAQALRTRAGALERAGVGLSRIDTTDGWSGPAGDAFRAKFQGQPGSWLQAGDCFLDAADALDSYSSTVTWAQGQAAEAVSQWSAAQNATKQAQATYVRYQQQGGTDPFQDPGDAGRAAARKLLGDTRSGLKRAGDSAAKMVAAARDKAPEKPSFWNDVKHIASEVGAGLENAGADVVNALTSVGNAAVHHPGDVAAMVGGTVLTGLSLTGELGGAVLDITGVGTVPGLALGAISTAGVAAGGTIAYAGARDLMMQAQGDDQVSPARNDHTGSDGGGSDDVPKEPSVTDRATALGYDRRIPAQRAPFNSHGQPVYFDGKNYITRDVDGHNVSDGWKMFNKRGQRIGTYDADLNYVKE
jgi:hypothetical protein